MGVLGKMRASKKYIQAMKEQHPDFDIGFDEVEILDTKPSNAFTCDNYGMPEFMARFSYLIRTSNGEIFTVEDYYLENIKD